MQPLDRFRSSTWGWLRGTVRGWGTLLLIPLGLGLTIFQFGAWALGLVGLALLIVAFKWIGNMAALYELTEDRIIIHRGIVMKSIDEIELYRVKDVRLDFSVISQVAKLGTITLNSSDETTRRAPLVMRDIENARARRETLRSLVDAARRRRGVRELDVVPEA